MKIFILTDLEGPAGVNGRADQVGNTMLNKPAAEQALVNEVNAVCDGLIAAGVDEIVVLDGHGGSNSMNIHNLHPRASLMQVGCWEPVAFLDGTFDAMIQLGAHGMQSSGGYMCHSYNSHSITEMRFNGEQIGEIGFSSYLAAYFKVPTIMVSGDDIACHEARALLGDDLTVVPTKATINRYATVNYPTCEVYNNLRVAAERAVKNIDKAKCLEIPDECELIVSVMCPNHMSGAIKLGIEQIDDLTLRYSGSDLIELWAQRLGWAPGVHQKRFNITPEWLHPYTLARKAFQE